MKCKEGILRRSLFLLVVAVVVVGGGVGVGGGGDGDGVVVTEFVVKFMVFKVTLDLLQSIQAHSRKRDY
jgi:hypothetical protein